MTWQIKWVRLFRRKHSTQLWASNGCGGPRHLARSLSHSVSSFSNCPYWHHSSRTHTSLAYWWKLLLSVQCHSSFLRGWLPSWYLGWGQNTGKLWQAYIWKNYPALGNIFTGIVEWFNFCISFSPTDIWIIRSILMPFSYCIIPPNG